MASDSLTRFSADQAPRRWFAAVILATIAASCLLAGLAPVAFSIAIVFLFAGPHNWLEARYMLARMPARWGRLRLYFGLGIFGAVALTVSAIVLPYGMQSWRASSQQKVLWLAIWNTLLVLWVLTLVELRSRQNPRRDWAWAWPIGLALLALNWCWPLLLSLALVYLHPLIALWFLDRELLKHRPQWRRTYHLCLLALPVCVAVLAWRLAAAPHLAGEDWLTQQMGLTRQIAHHAGGGIWTSVSTHFLVACHTFLEMLHYGVWVAALPLLSLRSAPWRFDQAPLARRSRLWRRGIIAFFAFGVLAAAALWSGFVIDYPWTRDVYFTVAMLHVLAEAPFLLRQL